MATQISGPANSGTLQTVANGDSQNVTIKEKINRCRNALFISDPDTDRKSLAKAKGERAEGTCEWILQEPQYQSWLAGEVSDLRITGGPGNGKTVLSLFLTEQLQARCQDTGDRLLSFFCQFHDDRYNDARAALRSLAYQLLEFSHDGPQVDEVLEYFETEQKTKDTLSDLESLWKIFETLLSQPGLPTIRCVVDAIDECRSPEPLEDKFFEYCRRREKWDVQAKFQLLILSRRYSRSNAVHVISLDDSNRESVTSDIEIYIKSRLGQLETMSGFELFRPEVTEVMLERSGGNFFWVSLVIQELSKGHTRPLITDIIEMFPTDLYAAFDRIIQGMGSKYPEESISALNLLAFAEGPLTMNELAAATTTARRRKHSEPSTEVMEGVIQVWRPFVEVHQGKVFFVHDTIKVYMKRGLAAQWLVELSGRPSKRRRVESGKS